MEFNSVALIMYGDPLIRNLLILTGNEAVMLQLSLQTNPCKTLFVRYMPE